MVSPDRLSTSGDVERQHDPRSDADQRAAFEQLRGDGARDSLGDQVVQRPFGARPRVPSGIGPGRSP